MTVCPTKILLIENQAADAKLIQSALGNKNEFHVVWVQSLAAALAHLHNAVIDIVLLDLALPDGKGLDVFNKVVAAAPNALTLVLGTENDQTLIQDAMTNGAHDYVSKGYIDAHWLPRALHYVIERKILRTALRDWEETAFEQQERAQVTLNSIGDGVLTTNLAGKVCYLNRVAESMTGWSLKEAIGLPLEKVFPLIDAETRKPFINIDDAAIESDTTAKPPTNLLLVRRDGTESPIEDSIAPIHNRDNKVTGAVIVFHDVSETRAIAKKMLHLAQHDFLTGLANRALLTERLTRALGLAQRNKKQVALLFIDLDNFKKINDSLGHAVGDKLLQSVAKRLQEVVRTTDTVCRQGGDEFVILLTEIEQRHDAAQVAEKLIAAFALPHIINQSELPITLSIGVSVYPDDCHNVEQAFQHADEAMYQAKKMGKNNYQFFNETKYKYPDLAIIK